MLSQAAQRRTGHGRLCVHGRVGKGAAVQGTSPHHMAVQQLPLWPSAPPAFPGARWQGACCGASCLRQHKPRWQHWHTAAAHAATNTRRAAVGRHQCVCARHARAAPPHQCRCSAGCARGQSARAASPAAQPAAVPAPAAHNAAGPRSTRCALPAQPPFTLPHLHNPHRARVRRGGRGSVAGAAAGAQQRRRR